ncbi:MAG TPA: CHAT domain-containing protein, partial [Bacteroidia bacterium]|nr:CHAT domain-containing protein [Bacteroidia bacterium]
ATHGFFLDELKTTAENQDAKGPVQNPMFRSGLALAGAQSTFNLWKGGQIPPPASDGVLLAAELTGINLRGTDLVVLSACETAAGESLDGEGVMGLRRALNAAGATNVVMTLWPVDDAATVEVMEVFYQKYLSGIPAAKALAETQRELLPQWIEQYGEIKALSRLAPFLCTSLGPVE